MSTAARYFTGIAVALLLSINAADAALTNTKCLAKKRQIYGKLAQCLAAADVKNIQDKPVDFGKCSTKFAEQLAKLNAKATAVGIGCRYLDNGDGTVTDFDTGLQWEMKNGADGAPSSNQHDVDNTYTWTALPGTFPPPPGGNGFLPNGTVFTSFLGTLNKNSFTPGSFGFFCFANHCDWRLPTRSELLDILVTPCAGGCIDETFGGAAAGNYATSTQASNDQTVAWFVNFATGAVAVSEKDITLAFARAVRDAGF